jgi:hypothetical protein
VADPSDDDLPHARQHLCHRVGVVVRLALALALLALARARVLAHAGHDMRHLRSNGSILQILEPWVARDCQI